MGAGHSHDVKVEGYEKPLWIALILTASFMVAEVVGGILTNSLALISDAAHMFTDSAALAISLLAIQIGKKAVDKKRTFGYHRFEILAAAFNAILLFGVAIYILVEAFLRISNPPDIQSNLMLIIASLGLLVNLIAMKLLSQSKDDSLNVKGAYLEVWSDMLGSVGVIVGALLIRWTGWGWIDSVIAVGIGLWVLPRAWALLKQSTHILLEGTPEHLNIDEIKQALSSHWGVDSIHDLHVWSISSGKSSLSVHVVCQHREVDWPDLLHQIRAMLAVRFDLHHTTIQLEATPCGLADVDHHYNAEPARP
ncbi:MAG: cation transporter [Limnobacter sp.]|jgi:cobalt-zinc-cadmium efflux system protein|uniref:cation diffusion facilitator family transporter n=1 Tax=Limnobacter sp. TaxID=2003368 RepID=UPI0012237EC5|nr:cation diffusion facilitator family transporter [Limnobacter sp.]MDZ4048586.1 cation diffusion facilitator family transporter [Limnobacter sp.]RZO91329.1 MAG: cation transporter [Limnobacter sp.]